MSPEQRIRLIDILASGEELAPEWSRILFPPEKREYELVYYGKEREEDLIANTLAVPLQKVRTFGARGAQAWENMLIFGDNLDYMWILGRETEIPDRIRNEFLTYALQCGYETGELVWTKH